MHPIVHTEVLILTIKISQFTLQERLSQTVSTSRRVLAGVNRSTGRRSPATTAAAPYRMAYQSGCAGTATPRNTRISLTQDTSSKVRKTNASTKHISYQILIEVLQSSQPLYHIQYISYTDISIILHSGADEVPFGQSTCGCLKFSSFHNSLLPY